MGSWFFWCSEDDFVCFPSTARLPNCPEVYCGSAGYMAPEPCRWTNKIYTEQLERSLPRGGGACTAIISILIFQDQLLWQNIHSNQLSSDLGHPIGLAAEIWCIVQIFLTVFWVEIPSPAPAGPLLWIKSLATSPAKSYEWSPANWADLFTISSFRFPTLKKRTFKNTKSIRATRQSQKSRNQCQRTPPPPPYCAPPLSNQQGSTITLHNIWAPQARFFGNTPPIIEI